MGAAHKLLLLRDCYHVLYRTVDMPFERSNIELYNCVVDTITFQNWSSLINQYLIVHILDVIFGFYHFLCQISSASLTLYQ